MTSLYTGPDRGDAVSETMTLDEAWAEAEAALPEAWYVRGLRRRYVGAAGSGKGWSATAVQGGIGIEVRTRGTVPSRAGFGPTPAAALQALATALRDFHDHP